MHDESENTFSMEGSSDSLDKFCEILKKDVLEIILNIGLTIEEIGLTIEEEFKWHKSQKLCYICREKFDYKSRNVRKVEDHYHFTGKY